MKKRLTQALAVLLCLGLALTLLAGCEFNRGEQDGAVVIPDVPENYDELSEEELRRLMNLGEDGYMTLPPGITEDETEPPGPPLVTMPDGTPVTTEMHDMVRGVVETLGSGRFYMSGRGTTPGDLANNANSPMVIAADGNRLMIETRNVDWALATQNESGRRDFGRSRVQAATLATFFGRTLRMIMTPQGPIIAFPDRNTFIDITGISEAMGEDEVDFTDFDMDFLGPAGAAGQDIPTDLSPTRIAVGDREYLRATLASPEAITHYFFRDGNLRRLEIVQDGEHFIFEIDELHGNPAARLFTTEGMRRAPMDHIMTLFGMGGGGMFG